MKKKLLLVLGVIFIAGAIGGFISEEPMSGAVILAVGIILLIRGVKAKSIPKEKKQEKQICTIHGTVKGHFLYDRQRALSKLYREHHNPEFEKDDSTVAKNSIKFVEEPDNEYDPNAIAILTIDGDMLGYVPRGQTTALRQEIDLNKPYTSYLEIYKDPKEYWAEFEVHQKK